jgi:hypothetical protein
MVRFSLRPLDPLARENDPGRVNTLDKRLSGHRLCGNAKVQDRTISDYAGTGTTLVRSIVDLAPSN